MPQLYFLSILCNGLAGYILFSDNDRDGENSQFSIRSPTFLLVLGIIGAVTGVLKLLSPSIGEGIPILSDLIPAAFGLVAGLMLIFGIYRQDVSSKAGELDRLGVSLLAFRKPIGIALMVCALIHFLFPEALFL
ncbi:MAG: hypothetical protein FWC01_00165 [Treponema sp.]|nr:hypothetical protein [Treponema sp.]MCL2236666.1 hypothetical protein [Treponema sp.]